MSPWVVVFLLIAGSWLVLLMTLGFAERMVDRRVRESLEVRQWPKLSVRCAAWRRRKATYERFTGAR
jgi:hypothetical protein